MKKLFISIAIVALSSSFCYANELSGAWVGALQNTLHLVFNFSKADNGDYTVTLDSPDQGVEGIPSQLLHLSNDSVAIGFKTIGAIYSAKIENTDTIKGTFFQMGKATPLTIVHGKYKVSHPQEPQKPYPYISEDISFRNNKADITLSGTLTIPADQKPKAAVVLITGSGGQNRDEEIMGHKPFLVLSDYLTRHGIAVLRYDDRGIGLSEGKQESATSVNFAYDAEAAINYLRSRNDMKKIKIGVAGHSEGGLISFILAAKTPDKANFIVSMAGTATSGDSIILDQQRIMLSSAGIPAEMQQKYIDANKDMMEIVANALPEYITQNIKSLAQTITAKYGMPESNAEKVLHEFNLPWWRFFLFTDPTEYISKITVPIYAINGDLDTQVLAEKNIPLIKKFAKGKTDVQIFKGKNHLFQQCKTGLTNEYASLEETFNEEVMQSIANWILKTCK